FRKLALEPGPVEWQSHRAVALLERDEGAKQQSRFGMGEDDLASARSGGGRLSRGLALHHRRRTVRVSVLHGLINSFPCRLRGSDRSCAPGRRYFRAASG